jgi:flotillin
MGTFLTVVFVLGILGVAVWQVLTNLIYICSPNEVLVFSGGKFSKGGKKVGYRVVKGGRALRIPFLEEVDRLDLTNMNVEVAVRNAFSKGGIQLNIDGIANVKISGESPGLDNALQRLLGKPRPLIMRIAKETLEGYLRGVLATLTPEEVNEDTIRFEKELRQQAGEGLERLGITLDNLKIQAVSDDQGYLTAMGRIQTAELARENRIAEAERRSESLVKQAEARRKGELAKIQASLNVANAESARRVANATTAQAAMVAQQQGEVRALLTRARAELALQDARIEQFKHQLNANIVEPAKAQMEAQIAQARGNAAPILENGRAQAEALRQLAAQWHQSGAAAKDIFLLQKLEAILPTYLESIKRVRIDNITMLQGMDGGGGGLPVKAVATVKALEAGGIDVGGLLARLTGGKSASAAPAKPVGLARPTPPAAPPPPPRASLPQKPMSPPPAKKKRVGVKITRRTK